MSDSFIEQNVDRANFERSADLEMDESNNTFKHAQLEGTRPAWKEVILLELIVSQSSSSRFDRWWLDAMTRFSFEGK